MRIPAIASGAPWRWRCSRRRRAPRRRARRWTSPASGPWSARWTTPRTRGSAISSVCRSILSLPEYQCRPHGWSYIYRGPTQLRITKEVDPFSREVVAYQPEWHQSTNMPVYLDGRDTPPEEANHTWGGFSTATWEGDMLR